MGAPQQESIMRVVRYSKEWAVLRDAGWYEAADVGGGVVWMTWGRP